MLQVFPAGQVCTCTHLRGKHNYIYNTHYYSSCLSLDTCSTAMVTTFQYNITCMYGDITFKLHEPAM